MGGYPIESFFYIGLALTFCVGAMIYGRRKTASQEVKYAHYRVGQMAQRLGMQLVAGDPMFNIFVPIDGSDSTQIRMQGAPHGQPLEFVYIDRSEKQSGFGEVTWTTWFECCLSATARQPFPPFEVVSRNAPLGPIATRQALPPMATGRPDIDAAYVVSTREPAMAAFLGEVLSDYSIFQGSGVHLVGDGQRVGFHMQRYKAPALASAMVHDDTMAILLSYLVRRLG